jgi:hypothetical protein
MKNSNIKRQSKPQKFNSFEALAESNPIVEVVDNEAVYPNKTQIIVYKRAIYGMKVINEHTLKRFNKARKVKIIKTHKAAQREINLLKQEKVMAITRNLLSVFTERSTFAKDLTRLFTKPNPHYRNSMSLKELGIEQSHVMERLFKKGILPKDFMTLK